MNWQQLIFVVDRETADSLSDHLEIYDPAALTLQDAGNDDQFETVLGEQPLWPQTRVVALFTQEVKLDDVIKQTCAEFTQKIHSYEIEILPEQDWVTAWKENFKPINFGQHLAICPSWHTPAADGRHHIILDPGLAFGTGTHPTTRLMLEWLDSAPIKDQTVIDYGCGSGILAIAALKMGAASVIGVDNDPNAVNCSLDNATQNNEPKLQAIIDSQFNKTQPVDIVLANILAQPLVELEPLLASLVKPHGLCVLSGILVNQLDFIRDAYQQDFEITQVTEDEGWLRIVCHKK